MEQYIGITGIRSIEEIKSINKIRSNLQRNFKFTPIGFGLVFYMNQRCDFYNISKLANHILENQKKDCAIIHLNDWQTANNFKIAINSLPDTALLQLNRFNWDNISFKKINFFLKNSKIILPYNFLRTTLNSCIEKLRSCDPDHISLLIDSSEGTGKQPEITKLLQIVESIRVNNPYLKIGLAGGLAINNKYHLLSNFQKISPFWMDAESGVFINKHLNRKNLEKYLQFSMHIIKPA